MRKCILFVAVQMNVIIRNAHGKILVPSAFMKIALEFVTTYMSHQMAIPHIMILFARCNTHVTYLS